MEIDEMQIRVLTKIYALNNHNVLKADPRILKNIVSNSLS